MRSVTVPRRVACDPFARSGAFPGMNYLDFVSVDPVYPVWRVGIERAPHEEAETLTGCAPDRAGYDQAMCYSAMVVQSWRVFMRDFGAYVDIDEFAKMYGYKRERKSRTPKAMDANLADPQTDKERAVKELIDAYNKGQLEQWEQELFKQRRRLADAERAITAGKATKKALDDQRIASSKCEQLKGWIGDMKRTEPKDRDSRIYPGTYAPVMVWQDGRRVIKPMRYQCRISGWTEKIERQYPGTYNARRDKLEQSWSKHFGIKHGVMLATAFYENVCRHTMEHRDLNPGEAEENVILEFRPRPTQQMIVACLWSDWSGPGEPELLSFAAITDEPPPEVLAAGHDRCIIPIKRENIDAWLQPGGDLARAYAILDDRERPYYEHRMAA